MLLTEKCKKLHFSNKSAFLSICLSSTRLQGQCNTDLKDNFFSVHIQERNPGRETRKPVNISQQSDGSFR